MEEKLNILMQSSEYYAPFAGVMLTSLLKNSGDIVINSIYLATADMSEKNRQRFLDLAEKYKTTIRFLNTTKIDDYLKTKKIQKYHGSYAAYYKIFAINFIEEDIERLIYLDSDTIVDGSLKNLIEFDLEDKVVAMALDVVSESYKNTIGFNGGFYYNTGVMLFDCKKWKIEGWEEKILDHMLRKRCNYPIADQDIINIVIQKKIKKLSLQFNFNLDIILFKEIDLVKKVYGINNYYSKEEFDKAVLQPIIYHYFSSVASSRPWFQECTHPLRDKWDFYLNQSPWSDFKKENENCDIFHKIQRLLYKFLPAYLFAFINRHSTFLYLKILNYRFYKDNL